MVEQLCIEEIISFHLDYDPDIVAQFFASVHFHTDEERTMTWMTNGERLCANWKEFMDLLHIRDEGLEKLVGLRPHENPNAAPKEKLLPYLIEKVSPTGQQSHVLNPFLDVMHRIFRSNLFARMGSKD
ncbi:hypothetical protein D1007_47608 [Hordeum vulgare]|nr:hypothetical protein D1007_47608 [Hordeum vulgare]